jgi:hypothetical protein
MAKRKRQTRQWPKEKDRQDNGQKIKDNMTNNDLPTITQKNKDRAIRTPLITGDELKYSGRVSSSFSTSGTRRVTLVTKPVIIYMSFSFGHCLVCLFLLAIVLSVLRVTASD